MTLQFSPVIGRFRTFITDGNDADELPELIPLKGRITLTPNVSRLIDTSDELGSVLGASPFIADVVDGQLSTQGQTNGKLMVLSTDNPDLNPSSWAYDVVFNLTTPDGRAVPLPPIEIAAPVGQTINLSRLVPADSSPPVGVSVAEAAAVRAEKAYLDLQDGQRLGAYGPNMSNKDANSILETGFYHGANMQNVPTPNADWVLLQVQAYSDPGGWVFQRAIQMTKGIDNGQGHTWNRSRSDGEWGAWIRFDADKVWADLQNFVQPLQPNQRLGTLGQDVGTTRVGGALDANALVYAGWYVGAQIPNAPTDNYCFLQVQTHTDTSWAQQRWDEFATKDGSGITNPRSWVRQRQGSGWTPYRLVSAQKPVLSVSASSNGQKVTPNGFVPITLPNMAADTANGWDFNNFWYTVPVTGEYDVSAAVRPADASLPGGTNFAVGVGPGNNDSELVYWYNAGAFRNTFSYARTSRFVKGDKVRLFVYGELGAQFEITNASLGMFLVAAD